jgi:hypothetical protein
MCYAAWEGRASPAELDSIKARSTKFALKLKGTAGRQRLEGRSEQLASIFLAVGVLSMLWIWFGPRRLGVTPAD